MRANTGRTVSAAIVQRLREALNEGDPLTYEQLAERADCTVRSVRNYLARSRDIFGFDIEKTRGPQQQIVVRPLVTEPSRLASPSIESSRLASPSIESSSDASSSNAPSSDASSSNAPSSDAPSSDAPTCAVNSDRFGDAFLRALFPGSRFQTTEHVVVLLPEFPHYGLHHADMARTWAEHSRTREHALRLCDRNSSTLYWPLMVVVHPQAGVVLTGIPVEAATQSHVVSISLHGVPDEPDRLEPIRRDPPAWLCDLTLEQRTDMSLGALRIGAFPVAALPGGALPVGALPLGAQFFHALPSSALPSTGESSDDDGMVNVHVRFDASLTERLRHCVWHRSQKVVLRTDGILDVRFGPVALPLAASWAASFGASVTVLGNKKLRKAVRKRSFAV